MVLLNGYSYNRDRILFDGSESFRCSKRMCKGRINVRGEEVNIVNDEHIHAPSPADNENRKKICSMKCSARNTMDNMRQIILTSQRNLSNEAAASAPKYTTLQRRLERTRKQSKAIPNEPQTLETLDIPENLQITHRGQQFLFHDSGRDDVHRFIMFCTNENLHLLTVNTHWFADGTFRVVSKLFNELYTIHAIVNNQMMPLVYVLCQNRTQEISVFLKYYAMLDVFHYQY